MKCNKNNPLFKFKFHQAQEDEEGYVLQLAISFFRNQRIINLGYIAKPQSKRKLLKKKQKAVRFDIVESDGETFIQCFDDKNNPINGKTCYWDGDFDCGENQLTSLKGCPNSISGDFYCHSNQLTSLEGCPISVDGVFYCDDNQLKTLEGFPIYIGGDFNCSYNKLKSFKGFSTYVGGDFYCSHNQLTSLEGLPTSINGVLDCTSNQLINLEGLPTSVNGFIDLSHNRLTSLEELLKSKFRGVICSGNNIIVPYHKREIINFYDEFKIKYNLRENSILQNL